MPTEIKLIIECCKTTKNTQLLTEYIIKIEDWDSFISLAYSHGIFSLVYRTLKEYENFIPIDIFSHMKFLYMEIVKQNMLMTSELIKVLKILEENGIEAISFKGPVLSQLAYGDVVSRQYCDLDILVKEKDLKKTFELLEKYYYKSSLDKEFIFNKLFLEKNSDIAFINNKNNLSIELHWKLFRNKFSSDIDNKDFFNLKNRLEINNQEFNVFNNELLLVYLCMHGSKHRWERIEWITDIDRLLKNYNIDLEIAYKIGEKYNCIKMLNLGLRISSELYDTFIPDKYIKELRKKSYKKMIDYILSEIDNINYDLSENRNNIASLKFHYNLNETFYEKVKFLKKAFLDISDNDTQTINSNSILIHYFMKPVRLFKKYFLMKRK